MLVQIVCDFLRAHAVDALAVDFPHHARRVLIYDEAVLVVWRFSIPIDWASAHIVAVLPLYLQCAPCFDGYIPAVGIIDKVLHSDNQIVAVMFVCRVNVVVNCDEADAVGWEKLAQVAPGFDVFAPQAGQILDDHTVDLARHDVVHHLLEVWPIEQNPAITVVDARGNKLNLRVSGQIVRDQPLLVLDAVALILLIIGIREPQILCRLILWHEKITPLRNTDFPHKRKE